MMLSALVGGTFVGILSQQVFGFSFGFWATVLAYSFLITAAKVMDGEIK